MQIHADLARYVTIPGPALLLVGRGCLPGVAGFWGLAGAKKRAPLPRSIIIYHAFFESFRGSCSLRTVTRGPYESPRRPRERSQRRYGYRNPGRATAGVEHSPCRVVAHLVRDAAAEPVRHERTKLFENHVLPPLAFGRRVGARFGGLRREELVARQAASAAVCCE